MVYAGQCNGDKARKGVATGSRPQPLRFFLQIKIIELFNDAVLSGTHFLFVGILYVKYNFVQLPFRKFEFALI